MLQDMGFVLRHWQKVQATETGRETHAPERGGQSFFIIIHVSPPSDFALPRMSEVATRFGSRARTFTLSTKCSVGMNTVTCPTMPKTWRAE